MLLWPEFPLIFSLYSLVSLLSVKTTRALLNLWAKHQTSNGIRVQASTNAAFLAKTPGAGPGLSTTRQGPALDHEAVLFAVVGHEDDVAVGGPDEAGQLQVILGARGRRLHGRNLVGLDAAQLRGRV